MKEEETGFGANENIWFLRRNSEQFDNIYLYLSLSLSRFFLLLLPVIMTGIWHTYIDQWWPIAHSHPGACMFFGT